MIRSILGEFLFIHNQKNEIGQALVERGCALVFIERHRPRAVRFMHLEQVEFIGIQP